MTNYEKLFQNQMQDSSFAKAYREAKLERILTDLGESLKRFRKMNPKRFC